MIPWGSFLLKQAPAVLAAADALLQRSRNKGAVADDLQALKKRIAELEQHQQASAELLKQLADHASAMAAAVQASDAKARRIFILAMAGVGLGVFATIVAWLR